MSTNVIVLNGASSSGKSSIARGLQTVFAEPWLTFGVDTLVDALPKSMQDSDAGIEFAADGKVTVGTAFRVLDIAWSAGIAAMATAGAHIIVDEVFLGGARSQERWRKALAGLEVVWVGVHCDAEEANRREVGRADRAVGMAATQARIVHDGVSYDIEVDTTHSTPEECAMQIARLARAERD